jgi:hypothetical protein
MRHAAKIELGLGCAVGSEHHGTIPELHVPFFFLLWQRLSAGVYDQFLCLGVQGSTANLAS